LIHIQSACRRHLREFPTLDYLVDRDGESNLRLFLFRIGNTKIREDIAGTWNHRTHWDLFVKMCNAIEGPLVTDAYVAALAIEHGCGIDHHG